MTMVKSKAVVNGSLMEFDKETKNQLFAKRIYIC